MKAVIYALADFANTTTHQEEEQRDDLPMYRLLGMVLMTTLIAACQPQTNIQTGLETLKTRLPSLSRNPQNETADDDVEWQDAGIGSEDNRLDAAASVIETAQSVATEPESTTPNKTAPATVEVTALNEDETGEPSVTAAKADGDIATRADNSALQIANLAESESQEAVESEFTTTLEDTFAKTDVATIQPPEGSTQGQVIVTEPPKAPDLVHPQTIIGQSIDDLGSSLGLPDFERSDSDVVIWQYRLSTCVTDFYLYLNGDDYVVKGWAWRAPFVNQTIDEKICQQQIGKLLDPDA